ncbi:MAG: NUDIX hydrolase [Gaiellaceae bacterium]
MNERTIARAVIFRGERVLLLRRAPDQRVAPGAWQCPAGKQEPGEAIEDTLARELHEETGLEVVSAVPLGVTSSEFEADGRPTTWHQHSFLVDATDGDVVLSREHNDFRWVPLAELVDFADLSPQVRSAIARGLAAREHERATRT